MSKISTKRDPLADIKTHFPAPPEQELIWEGEEYEKRVKSAAESRIACEVYKRYERYPGEFLVHHGYNLYHVRLTGIQGSCSCNDFFYRAGDACIPCKHIILAKTREPLPPNPLLEDEIRQLCELLSALESSSKPAGMPEKSTTAEHLGGEKPPSGNSQVGGGSLISRAVDLKDAEVTETRAPEKNYNLPKESIFGGENPPSGNSTSQEIKKQLTSAGWDFGKDYSKDIATIGGAQGRRYSVDLADPKNPKLLVTLPPGKETGKEEERILSYAEWLAAGNEKVRILQAAQDILAKRIGPGPEIQVTKKKKEKEEKPQEKPVPVLAPAKSEQKGVEPEEPGKPLPSAMVESRPPSPSPASEPKPIEAELIRHPNHAHPVIAMIRGISPSLAEIGKIKIGVKGEVRQSAGGKTFLQPRKLDHFEIFTNVRDREGRLVRDEAMMKLIGDKCTELDIHLLYNRIDLNFPTSYARYEGGKCVCRGDGELAYEVQVQSEDGNGNLAKPIRCSPDTCQYRFNRKCKPNGVLSVVLDKSERIGGVYKFRTTSYHTIRNILSSMALIQALTGGVLSGVPLKMVLRPRTVHPVESPTPQVVYVVNIEYSGGIQKLLSEAFEIAKAQSSHIENMRKLELIAQEALALPEPPEEARDVQDEFYPDGREAADGS